MKITLSQRNKKFAIGFIASTVVCFFTINFFMLSHIDSASAARKEDWNPGNIITDAIFTDKDSMSVDQIQSFLNQNIGICDTNGSNIATEYGTNQTRAQYAASRGWQGPPYTCLNIYYEVPKTSPGRGMPSNNYSNPSSRPAGSQSAAWIIKDAANRYSISPKVLLVKIATESAGPLTSDKWPLLEQYRYAMGARCPDSGPGGSANCDEAYTGFSIQMYEAARLMRWYLDSMDQSWWSYKKPYQSNNILWNVAPRGCGGSNVHIENKATAALYTYTPYQPNQAALNNMYGTGDNCSAYGNRNFWRVFWDWFGPTRPIATVYTQTASSIVDTAGSRAEIRFSLSQKPVAEVVLVLTTTNNQLVGFNNSNTIKIQPENWNKPEKNSVTLFAKKASLTQAVGVHVRIDQIGSPDNNFRYIDTTSIGSPVVLWQPQVSNVYRLFSNSENRHIYASRSADIEQFVLRGYTLENSALLACPAGESSIVRYRKNSEYRLALSDSTTAKTLLTQGYLNDGAIASYSKYSAQIPVYELRNPSNNNYLYTTSSAEASMIETVYKYVRVGIPFYTCKDGLDSPLFRLYSSKANNHFYTKNPNERDAAIRSNGYKYEGVQLYHNDESNPVYRLFSQAKQSHFYTTGLAERQFAEKNGYKFEGIAFYISREETPQNSQPTYRLYNKNTGKHFFTTSISERDGAQKSGFSNEGIAWYTQNTQ